VRLLEVTLPTILGACELAGYQGHNGGLADDLREAVFVMVQSEYSAQAVQALGIAPDKIMRCHLGVDTSYYRPRAGDQGQSACYFSEVQASARVFINLCRAGTNSASMAPNF
jgi:hypothetical protein